MSERAIDIRIPRRWIAAIRLTGAAVGFGAALIAGPVVSLLLRLAGDAPGPLRLAASLPLISAIPVLTAAGLGIGFWITKSWQEENGTIKIASSGVTVQRTGHNRHVPRDRIAEVFTDGGELVIVATGTNELLRVKSDKLLIRPLRDAFKQFGYPWHGTSDPYSEDFRTWVDGSTELDARGHELLRARQRALADKRAGSAEDTRDGLGDIGVVVRDRGGEQQYRIINR